MSMVRPSLKGERDRNFRLVFALAFPVFLASAVVARLSPSRSSAFAVHRRGSVFAEARATAYRTLPYAF